MSNVSDSTGSKDRSSAQGMVAKSNSISPAGKIKLEDLPELTYEMVPKEMGKIAKAISESQQVPKSLAILTAIGIGYACKAGKSQVAPVSHNWDAEKSSFNAVIIAKSSGGKSRVFNKLTKPLEEWESKKRLEVAPMIADALAKVADAETRSDKIAELKKVPVFPDMRVQDTTPEKLTMRMRDHYGRLALLSSEGGPLKNLDGKKFGTPPEFELWKKCWDSEDHREDRVGAGSREVRNPVLTSLLMVQPAILDALGANPSLRGEGLLERFLFLALPDNRANLQPSRKAPALKKEILERWKEICFRLLDADHKGTTSHLSPTGGEGLGVTVQQVPILHDVPLSEGAQSVMDKFDQSMINEQQEGHRLDLVASHAEKCVGISLRLGEFFEVFSRACEMKGQGKNKKFKYEPSELFNTAISEKCMEMAVQVVDVLTHHFSYVMEDRSSFNLQTYILDKLDGLGGEASRRDLRRKCRAFKNDASLEPYLALLEQTGRITREEKKSRNQVVSEIIKSIVNTD